MKVPASLDGAKVLKWAWSGEEPFGCVGSSDNSSKESIYGLAICQYPASETVYRFSCDKDWNVIQDADYDSIEEAIEGLPQQYKNVMAIWKQQ
jgi:hypothetical protein